MPDPDDAELVARFAAARSPAAFAELVRRHGPLVMGVCRRTLGDRPEADDAFQATFLVLAKKAARVRDPARLGPWLYGVAVRVSGKARGRQMRQRRRERPLTDHPAPPRDSDLADVRPVLDAELARLPDKLRAALVLCELQGLNRDEAATRLNIPAGTLASRLARAKDALRSRLTRRGLTLSAGGLSLVLSDAASAAVPAAVVEETAAAAAAVSPEGTPIVAKILLTLLAAVGLTAAGVTLVPGRPADPPTLVGKWAVVSVQHDGEEVTRGELLADKVVEFTADRTTLGGPTSYVLYPKESPAQIDTVPLEGPPTEKGRKFEGVYKLDGDTLTLHFAGRTKGGRSLTRPTGFDCRRGDESTRFVLMRLPEEALIVGDADRIHGPWKVIEGGTPWGPTKDEWMFRGGHITVPAAPLRPDDVRYTLRPDRLPREIDVTTADGAVSLGVYRFEGVGRLVLHVADPGRPRPASADRDTETASRRLVLARSGMGPGGGGTGGEVTGGTAPPDTKTALWGRWQVTALTVGGKPDASLSGQLWSLKPILPAGGAEVADAQAPARDVTFRLDPKQPDRQVELTFDAGPCQAAFRLVGDDLTLTLDRPVPGSAVGGPAVVTLRRERDDLSRLQGKWEITAAKTGGGRDHPEQGLAGGTVEFAGDRLTLSRPGPDGQSRPAARTVTLDPTRSPKWLDLAPSDGPDRQPSLALYDLTADGLTLAFAKSGQPRPASLTPAADDRSTLVLTLCRPAARDAVRDELAKLQGRWQLVSAHREGKPDPGWSAGKVFVFDDGLHWVARPDGGRQDECRVTLHVGGPERGIDLVQNLPPGDKRPPQSPVRGLYAVTGDDLRLVFGKPGDPRPAGAGPLGGGPGVTVFQLKRDALPPGAVPTRRPVPEPKAPADDLSKLEGRWRVVEALDAGRPTPPGAAPTGSFTFAGDRLAIDRGDGRHEEARVKLDAGRSPKWIDLTQEGGARPQTLLGLYELRGDLLIVGYGPDRPKSLTEPERSQTRFVLMREPAVRPDPAKLRGWWVLESMALVGGPKPRPFDDSALVITADTWTTTYTDTDGQSQRVPYRLTVDLSESPGRYDLRRVMGPGEAERPPVRGVYVLDGDTLTVAQAFDPRPRPAGVTPETAGKDNYIYRYRRAAGPPTPKPRAAVPTTLRGKWVVKSAVHDGKPAPADFPLVGKTFDVTADRFDVLGQARYVLHPKPSPAHIDLTVLDGPAGVRGDKVEGIYKREGDTLTVCVAGDDQPRPTTFESKPGGKTTLLVLTAAGGG